MARSAEDPSILFAPCGVMLAGCYVLQGREKIFPVKVERGKVIQVRGGAVHHNSLIGKEYGSKVRHCVCLYRPVRKTQTSSQTVALFYTLLFFLLPPGEDVQWQELGVCTSSNTRALDGDTPSPNTDSLLGRHQRHHTPPRPAARVCGCGVWHREWVLLTCHSTHHCTQWTPAYI